MSFFPQAAAAKNVPPRSQAPPPRPKAPAAGTASKEPPLLVIFLDRVENAARGSEFRDVVGDKLSKGIGAVKGIGQKLFGKKNASGGAAGPREKEKQFNPVVEMLVMDKNGKALSHTVTTTGRKNCNNPIYRSYFELGRGYSPKDVLCIRLFLDGKLSSRRLLGIGKIELSALNFNNCTRLELPKSDAESDLLMTPAAICRMVKPPMTNTKTVFLIRHGESEWNEAQAKKQVGGLLAFDHPLNEAGIAQGKELNNTWKAFKRNKEWATTARTKAYSNKFLLSSEVYSSPLTRATQTALLTLEGHPAVSMGKGFELKRFMREVRRSALSLDVVGRFVGTDIREKSLQKMQPYLGEKDTGRYGSMWIDPGDSASEWWSNGPDASSRVKARLDEMMMLIKYTEGESLIFVGHSLFFKAFCKKFAVVPAIKMLNPELAANMGTHKMQNAGCMGLTIDCSRPGIPKIVDAEMLFGTTLLGQPEPDDLDDEEHIPRDPLLLEAPHKRHLMMADSRPRTQSGSPQGQSFNPRMDKTEGVPPRPAPAPTQAREVGPLIDL